MDDATIASIIAAIPLATLQKITGAALTAALSNCDRLIQQACNDALKQAFTAAARDMLANQFQQQLTQMVATALANTSIK